MAGYEPSQPLRDESVFMPPPGSRMPFLLKQILLTLKRGALNVKCKATTIELVLNSGDFGSKIHAGK